MKDGGKVLLLLLTGAVAGAVAALLLAPQSGEETRKQLKKTAGKLKDDIGSTVKNGIDKINTLRKETTAREEV